MGDGIRFEHIYKSFPGVQALENVSFSIEAGEVHAILGENGAGKTTLLNILHGIYQADTGRIFLGKDEINFKSPNEAIMGGISKVHQEINAVKDLTVGQNITLGQEIMKNGIFVNYQKTDRIVNGLLEKLHCSFKSDDLVASLSAGEMQMIAIAKALYNNSKVISFDEPTASLTETETKALFSIIGELKKAGITIIYVSHRLEEIFQICDRATILRDGRYITTLNVAATTRKELITCMVGKEINADVHHTRRRLDNSRIALKVENFCNGTRFNNINFELRHGEILGFFGLVGAGRTEVMRAVFGADRKTCGNLYFEGRKVSIKNTQDALTLGIGLLPEERKTQGFVDLMSNLDNTSLSVLPRYVRHGFVNRRLLVENYKTMAAELRIHPDDPYFLTVNLSGGNQQKVILARWLSTDSSILIFDEPTKGIDVATKVEIYKLMEKAIDSGKSIIMISSELPEVLSVSDRIVVMYEGNITAVLENDGTLNDNDILEYAMGETQK